MPFKVEAERFGVIKISKQLAPKPSVTTFDSHLSIDKSKEIFITFASKIAQNSAFWFEIWIGRKIQSGSVNKTHQVYLYLEQFMGTLTLRVHKTHGAE